MQSKICGVKDSETLNFLINYKYPPELIGFICNYSKFVIAFMQAEQRAKF